METPVILIDGEEIKAPEPKTKLWRLCIKFDDNAGKRTDDQFLTGVEEIICETFQNPKVTAESIEENMDLPELFPFYRNKIRPWVTEMVFAKISQLPNSPTPAAE